MRLNNEVNCNTFSLRRILNVLKVFSNRLKSLSIPVIWAININIKIRERFLSFYIE